MVTLYNDTYMIVDDTGSHCCLCQLNICEKSLYCIVRIISMILIVIFELMHFSSSHCHLLFACCH